MRYDQRCHELFHLLGILHKNGPERRLMRRLQRYAVTVYDRDFTSLLGNGDIIEAAPGIFVQLCDTLYDPELGLIRPG